MGVTGVEPVPHAVLLHLPVSLDNSLSLSVSLVSRLAETVGLHVCLLAACCSRPVIICLCSLGACLGCMELAASGAAAAVRDL